MIGNFLLANCLKTKKKHMHLLINKSSETSVNFQKSTTCFSFGILQFDHSRL